MRSSRDILLFPSTGDVLKERAEVPCATGSLIQSLGRTPLIVVTMGSGCHRSMAQGPGHAVSPVRIHCCVKSNKMNENALRKIRA